MQPHVDHQEHSTPMMTNSGDAKLFSHYQLLQSRESCSSHDTLLEEQQVPLSSEFSPSKRVPRWIINTSSSLNNYTRLYMTFLHLVIAILIITLWFNSWSPENATAGSGGSWCTYDRSKVYHRSVFYLLMLL